MQCVYVIHWRFTEAGALIDLIRAAGFAPRCDPHASVPDIARAITATQPSAIVIDLSRLPGHGREVAAWLRRRKSTREIPLVFVGGEPEKIAKIREVLPDATCTTAGRVASALRRVCRNRPAPMVVPPGLTELYQARTTAQKLGIKAGGSVGIIDPPRDYLAALGELPAEVELIENPSAPQPLTLWFVHEEETLLRALRRMRSLAAKSRLWLLWRKGLNTGIKPSVIRAAAREAGLIDYKICSVDARWSGMALACSKA